jgi:hypothetical protein
MSPKVSPLVLLARRALVAPHRVAVGPPVVDLEEAPELLAVLVHQRGALPFHRSTTSIVSMSSNLILHYSDDCRRRWILHGMMMARDRGKPRKQEHEIRTKGALGFTVPTRPYPQPGWCPRVEEVAKKMTVKKARGGP